MNAPWPRLLLPLGVAYGGAAALRARLYRSGWLHSARLDASVISVGNLSVGGSGKTPLVRWIAERLRAAGRRVAVLSRGYGGSHRGDCLVVSDGERLLAGADAAGDEPVMLARALPDCVVAVGRHRDVVGREVLARFGPRVLVLDDGFQHLRLQRQLDIVCVSARDLKDWPMPAGRLREFRTARTRADVIVQMLEPGEDAGNASSELTRARRRGLGFFSVADGERPAPRRAWLLSGIGQPERFAADMRRLVAVAGHDAFPDHHRFTASELLAVLERASRSGADAVVTTEKDAARLPDSDAKGPELLVHRIALEVLDEAPFLERLLAAAGTAT